MMCKYSDCKRRKQRSKLKELIIFSLFISWNTWKFLLYHNKKLLKNYFIPSIAKFNLTTFFRSPYFAKINITKYNFSCLWFAKISIAKIYPVLIKPHKVHENFSTNGSQALCDSLCWCKCPWQCPIHHFFEFLLKSYLLSIVVSVCKW